MRITFGSVGRLRLDTLRKYGIQQTEAGFISAVLSTYRMEDLTDVLRGVGTKWSIAR